MTYCEGGELIICHSPHRVCMLLLLELKAKEKGKTNRETERASKPRMVEVLEEEIKGGEKARNPVVRTAGMLSKPGGSQRIVLGV